MFRSSSVAVRPVCIHINTSDLLVDGLKTGAVHRIGELLFDFVSKSQSFFKYKSNAEIVDLERRFE